MRNEIKVIRVDGKLVIQWYFHDRVIAEAPTSGIGSALAEQIERMQVEIERMKELLTRDSTELRDMFRELEIDNHYWQARPCPTCKTVSKVLKRDFGCVAKCQTKRGKEANGSC